MWVLIDLSYMANRAMYSVKDYHSDDFAVGFLMDFFEQLKDLCRHPRIQSSKMVMFFDSRKSYRKKLFPGYKEKRKISRTDEEQELRTLMHCQEKILKEHIIPDMGIQTIRQTGLEADDTMAMAVLKMQGPEKQAVIITSDRDLLQCVKPHIHWFDPGRDVYMTATGFIAKYGIQADRFGEVKAIGGCVSDSVPGVPRVGEPTAIKYLNHNLPKHHKTYQTIISNPGQETIARNRKLVLLPHELTKPVELKAPEFNPEAFFEHCKNYGMTPYLKEKKQQEWIKFFSNIERPEPKIRKRKSI